MIIIITVVDSMPGTGKTSKAISMMQENPETNYIYITPFLSEVDRVKKAVTNRKFYDPTNKNRKGTKLEGLKELILKDKDIISTHALFSSVDEEIIDLLKACNYVLILDEVMNVIETLNLKTCDFKTLLDQGVISIEEKENRIIWNHEDYEGRFDDIKRLSKNNNLFYHSRNSGGSNTTLLVWTFPIQVFQSFKDTYILTYLFKGQLQKYYYDMYKVDYNYLSVRNVNGKFDFVDYIDYKTEDRSMIRQLVNIYDGKLNNIGDEEYSLSASWLKNPKNKDKMIKLKNNTLNYYKNIIKTKAKFNMWTTLMSETLDKNSSAKIKTILSGNSYSSGFVACNCRATNDYSHKITCAYLLNRFLNPLDAGFFIDKGIDVNEDLWALSELLQWIWRSRVRNSEMINIFLPSERMRNLLIQYIGNEI